jgi:outer membrane protein OmpA-like peptidoglycan-associated protein
MIRYERPLVALSAGALALLIAACGGSRQVQPTTARGGVTSMQAIEAPPRLLPDTATASSIQISTDILRACDIPEASAKFPFDSARVPDYSVTPLQSVARCFETGPLAGHHMTLVGHADPRGTDDYNMVLGLARADSVAKYLADQGLSRDAMVTSSRGALDATGTDEIGWGHDRRVDVLLAE